MLPYFDSNQNHTVATWQGQEWRVTVCGKRVGPHCLRKNHLSKTQISEIIK